MPDPELIKSDALLPLSTAARICYAAVYSHRVQDVPLFDEQLTGLAQAITALVPLYVRRSTEPLGRRLAEEEWAGGRIRRGGRELHFVDGRAPLVDLHVARASIDEAIKRLSPSPDA